MHSAGRSVTLCVVHKPAAVSVITVSVSGIFLQSADLDMTQTNCTEMCVYNILFIFAMCVFVTQFYFHSAL